MPDFTYGDFYSDARGRLWKMVSDVREIAPRVKVFAVRLWMDGTDCTEIAVIDADCPTEATIMLAFGFTTISCDAPPSHRCILCGAEADIEIRDHSVPDSDPDGSHWLCKKCMHDLISRSIDDTADELAETLQSIVEGTL